MLDQTIDHLFHCEILVISSLKKFHAQVYAFSENKIANQVLLLNYSHK
jgi:hypothetical protein